MRIRNVCARVEDTVYYMPVYRLSKHFKFIIVFLYSFFTIKKC